MSRQVNTLTTVARDSFYENIIVEDVNSTTEDLFSQSLESHISNSSVHSTKGELSTEIEDFSLQSSICTYDISYDDIDVIFDHLFMHTHPPLPLIIIEGNPESFLPNLFKLPEITPQGFLSTAATTFFFSQLKNGNLNNVILSRIEVGVAAYAVLSECTSVKAFIGALFLVLKTEYHDAITKDFFSAILKYLDINPDAIEPQAGAETPTWLKLLKSAGDNWQLALTNQSMTRVHKLITMMVTLGLCGPLNMKFGNLSLFAVSAEKEQIHATSFIDACFKTAIFLAESGYAAFTTNSLMPFLFTNDNAVRLDLEYLELLDLFDYAIPGNLEKLTTISSHDFMYRLDKCIEETELMFISLPNSAEKRLIMTRLTMLRSKRSTYVQTKVTGGLREAPYSFFITGGSGLGKTDIADILYKACGAYNGIDVSQEMVTTFNSDDKYMSSWKSYMTVLKFDDFANTKSDFMQVSPTAMLIKVINNVRESAVKADIIDKSKCSIEPKFVTLTGNVMDCDAGTYSNCPGSVLRRGKVHIVSTVKPQFRQAGSLTLDSAKANAFYTKDGIIMQPDIPDLWNCTVYKAELRPSGMPTLNGSGGANKQVEQVAFVPIEHNGVPMVDCSILTVVDYCMLDSHKHFAEQKELIKRTDNTAAFIPCEGCKRPTQLCNCAIVPHGLFSHARKLVNVKPYMVWQRDNVRDNIILSWDNMLHAPSAAVGKFISKLCIRKLEETVSYGSYQYYALTHRHSDTLLAYIKNFENSHFLRWTTYVPESWLENQYVWSFMLETRVTTLSAELTEHFWLPFYKWTNYIVPSFWAIMWFWLVQDIALPIF